MPKADFTHEIEIGVPPGVLHDFLVDLHHFAALHPLIESIEDLPLTDERPHARRYRVVDRIPIGPFHYRIRYIAELESSAPDEIQGRAWQSPGVRLHTIYTLRSVAGGTHLFESVEVAAPWILRNFVIRQADRAHGETLRRIKSLLERGFESSTASRLG